ncbi:MAG: hypothetical protein Q4B67_02650 [Eubacteriales bacterium]|nr:hypothetical protein [Eubacteriales bacterium]
MEDNKKLPNKEATELNDSDLAAVNGGIGRPTFVQGGIPSRVKNESLNIGSMTDAEMFEVFEYLNGNNE